MESFIAANGNRFSGWQKPFSFTQSYSSVKTVSKINGSQFLKKDHILTNENSFCGWWKQFSAIFLESCQVLPVEAIFHLTRTYWKCGNQFFHLLCLLLYS